jgi:AcrR family transcriptional regulator
VAEQWADVLDEHRTRQRRQIMTVALELVAERGLAGVSMSALAQRAGISRATLYHYFPDLEQVLLAWVGEEVDSFVAELARELSTLDDPVAQLYRIVDAHVTAFSGAEHRFGADLLQSDVLSPKVREEVGRHLSGLRGLVASVLEDGVRAGCFGATASDPLAVDAVVSVLGAARPHLLAGTAAPEEVSTFLVALLVHGLAGDGRGGGASEGGPRRAAVRGPSEGSASGVPGAARPTEPKEWTKADD